MIYFDNAATSWPKPAVVTQAMVDFMKESAANPGRGGHSMSVSAGRVVYRCREALSSLFNISDPSRLIFTQNATMALNVALFGVLRPGDHCVTTSWEHNAVARPLEALRQQGVAVTVVPCDPSGNIDVDVFAAAMRPNTRLMAAIHASNVTGCILPVRELAQVAHRGGAVFLLDAAQTAGAMEIDVQALGVDLMAAPGHKSLLGPMGTGLLYMAPDISISPMFYGGTGSYSELMSMPEELPDKFEAGTLNAPGLAGLHAATKWLMQEGIAKINSREKALMGNLHSGLRSIPGVVVYGNACGAPVLAFNVASMSSVEVSSILDASFDICTRSGLHCAPLAHRTLGTIERGAVRVSPGPFTSEDDIIDLLTAVEEIALC